MTDKQELVDAIIKDAFKENEQIFNECKNFFYRTGRFPAIKCEWSDKENKIQIKIVGLTKDE